MSEINVSHRTEMFFKVDKKGNVSTFKSLPELLQHVDDAKLLLKRKIGHENPNTWNDQYFFYFSYIILNKSGKERKTFKSNGFKVELGYGEDVSGTQRHWNANKFGFSVCDLNNEVKFYETKIKSTEVDILLAAINSITLILKDLRYWTLFDKYYVELEQLKTKLDKHDRFIKQNNLEEQFKKFW